MAEDAAEPLIRQAIAGNDEAVAWVRGQADVTHAPDVLALGALLAPTSDGAQLLDRAAAEASCRADRQLVAIVRAHLAGDRDLVDALARDHLVDFPGSYLVAWIASGAEVGGGA